VAQDKLALDADEEKANELEHELVSGQERTVWNLSLSIPAKEFEFTDAEVVRVKAAIETWDAYGAAADRRWLEPLLNALAPTQTRDLRSRFQQTTPHGRQGRILPVVIARERPAERVGTPGRRLPVYD
jgi:hypothetical protein